MSLGRNLLLIVGGAVVAVAVAVLLALFIKGRGHGAQTPPPASTGGLVVQTGQADNGKLDPQKSLRCFVGGKFEGVETLADCARKNGVATDALDVGVDQTGALAAANGQGASLTPLAPPADSSAPAAAPDALGPAASTRPPVADCLRYAGGTWRKTGAGLTLSACVQALFAGRCVPPGEVAYGRWGENALRLVPHRVEMSDDNHSFRTLAEQNDEGCVIPQF